MRLCNIFVNECDNNDCSILIGDMNIDVRENINNEYLDMMAEQGFKYFINIFTRSPAFGNHSCLDHIFIKHILQTILLL